MRPIGDPGYPAGVRACATLLLLTALLPGCPEPSDHAAPRKRDEPAPAAEQAPPKPAPPELAAKVEPKTRTSSSLAACSPQTPPELERLRFPADAPWRALVPFTTTEPEVRRLLGKPRDQDLDEGNGPTLLIYDTEGPWEVFVYLVEASTLKWSVPVALHRTVASVELLPKGDAPSFAGVSVPEAFTPDEVLGADAHWVDFRHPSGLTYSVYGSLGALEGLSRVSFEASACQREALGLSPAG